MSFFKQTHFKIVENKHTLINLHKLYRILHNCADFLHNLCKKEHSCVKNLHKPTLFASNIK